MQNFGPKGKNRSVTYDGPVLIARFSVPRMNTETSSSKVTKGRNRKVTAEGRLNNPRKSQQAVLREVCAKVVQATPGAKLLSWSVK